jgi:hypothetical protein
MPFIEVKATRLPGVLLLKPQRFPDERGHFVETFNARASPYRLGTAGSNRERLEPQPVVGTLSPVRYAVAHSSTT